MNCANGRARFKINRESSGVYYAQLMHFEGSKNTNLPQEIILTRGIRHWTGSINNEAILNELGKIIEDFFPTPTKEDNTRPSITFNPEMLPNQKTFSTAPQGRSNPL